MNPEFWQEKWQNPQPGFHQAKPNQLLVSYFKSLSLAPASRIFVPLCGKSIDMLWLAEQGYDVIGSELIDSAVQQFFSENNIEMSITKHPKNESMNIYQGQYAGRLIQIFAGDIFELSPTDLGTIDAVYDRAALVAMPDKAPTHLRRQYVQQVIKLTQTAPQLLLNFALNAPAMDEATRLSRQQGGPPFVVSDDAIYGYYQEAYQVEFLGQDAFEPTDRLINQAWRLINQS